MCTQLSFTAASFFLFGLLSCCRLSDTWHHAGVHRHEHHLSLRRGCRSGRLGNLDENRGHNRHSHCTTWEHHIIRCCSRVGISPSCCSSSCCLLLHHKLLLGCDHLLHHVGVHALGHHRHLSCLTKSGRHKAWRHPHHHGLSTWLLLTCRWLLNLWLLFCFFRLFRLSGFRWFFFGRRGLWFFSCELFDSVDEFFLFDIFSCIRCLTKEFIAFIFIIIVCMFLVIV